MNYVFKPAFEFETTTYNHIFLIVILLSLKIAYPYNYKRYNISKNGKVMVSVFIKNDMIFENLTFIHYVSKKYIFVEVMGFILPFSFSFITNRMGS